MNPICILHSTSAPFETRYCAGALSRSARDDLPVSLYTMGAGGHWRSIPAAVRALRHSPPRLVHAWGLRSLVVAILSHCPAIVFAPSTDQPALLRRSAKILRAISERLDIQIVCPTTTLQQFLIQHGIGQQRCHLIRPGVDRSDPAPRQRNSLLRQRLGIKADEIVILAGGESTRQAAHELGAQAVAILRVSNPRYRLLIWGRGEQASKIVRAGQQFDAIPYVINAEQTLGQSIDFHELLPVADLALMTGSGVVPTVPIAMCMAGGLPIIATATTAHRELFEDRQTALLIDRPHARDLARQLLLLCDDPNLQQHLATRAQAQAKQLFSPGRFIERHHSLYQQIIAGGTICLEPHHGL
ncbi:MAG: glycosyltransferase family 4 protein [Phycisphaerales bacterium]|nr:glycosyltransferase family 4 protein [Phycisphaerales bacterium]